MEVGDGGGGGGDGGGCRWCWRFKGDILNGWFSRGSRPPLVLSNTVARPAAPCFSARIRDHPNERIAKESLLRTVAPSTAAFAFLSTSRTQDVFKRRCETLRFNRRYFRYFHRVCRLRDDSKRIGRPVKKRNTDPFDDGPVSFSRVESYGLRRFSSVSRDPPRWGKFLDQIPREIGNFFPEDTRKQSFARRNKSCSRGSFPPG